MRKQHYQIDMCQGPLAGKILLFALPLKFLNADGAPIRAVAEFRDFSEKEMVEP